MKEERFFEVKKLTVLSDRYKNQGITMLKNILFFPFERMTQADFLNIWAENSRFWIFEEEKKMIEYDKEGLEPSG